MAEARVSFHIGAWARARARVMARARASARGRARTSLELEIGLVRVSCIIKKSGLNKILQRCVGVVVQLNSTSIVPGQSSAAGSLGIFFRSRLPAL